MQNELDVSRETKERLEVYENLLRKWNPKINLVSQSSLQNIWSRHFMDSLQIFDIKEAASGTWLDLGSGGGFPGLIVALQSQETGADVRVKLMESDQRKAAFLRTAARQMELQVEVLATRIEDAEPQLAETVSARALAPLDKLFGYVHRHLLPTGTAIIPKGATWEKEIDIAKQHWRFDCRYHKSITDPHAVILEIGDLEHV